MAFICDAFFNRIKKMIKILDCKPCLYCILYNNQAVLDTHKEEIITKCGIIENGILANQIMK
ncbi:hypothetical protein [Clostridioides sp. ES-S-0145-01]|uniref:hypothetical protein n=1 Tax=Clostridioides sp. ES-S-0145-01 TaxID=2770784 RepID=UPI001D11662A